MLRYGLFILLALAGLLLQATLFAQISSDALKPDLAFLIAVYLGLHKPSGEATPAVVVIGYLADRFSALPDGTFLLVYLCAFYLAGASARVFYFRGTGFPALMVLGLSALYGVALDLMVRYGRAAETGHGMAHGIGFLSLFVLVNVAFALPLYRLCRVIDKGDDLRQGQRATL